MESRISITLTQWFPNAFTEVPKTSLKTDYDFLSHFAEYVEKLIKEDSETKREPFKIINLLYSKGTLYERNAIENSFFYKLAFDENAHTLKDNLDLMPEPLRVIYIKTILEN